MGKAMMNISIMLFLFNINLHDKSDSGYLFGIFKLLLNLCRCKYMYQN